MDYYFRSDDPNAKWRERHLNISIAECYPGRNGLRKHSHRDLESSFGSGASTLSGDGNSFTGSFKCNISCSADWNGTRER